ncbi:MAG TPA: hypothetical protein VLF43_03470, partial [Candidatus Saccharimonadales bacterium]|nr:hypothetical protein [Candidatus Saccharimonadales bacterium]
MGTATSALIPSHTYAFAKDNGVSQIIAKLNPDVSNAVVKATRHLHYLQGEPDTYTFTRQGSQFISPEMKVPSCSNIDPVDPNKVNEQSTFDVTAYDSTGNTEIGKNDNGGAGFTLCEEQKTVTVNVVPVSQQAKVGSICGTLQYTDLVSNKAAPYQSDSTVTLTGSKALSSDGSKTLTTHTDNNGKYCFKNLPPAAGYSLAAHYGYTDSGGLSQLDSFTKDNITVTAGKTTTIDHVGAASGSSSNASASSTATCESSGASLSWIMCPIINDLISAVDGIYSKFVQPLLYTSPINLTDPQDDPTKVFQIWSNFRVYGDIFLVIALLVVVFGQSLGGGLIDAYAAKKILPRLLLAAIAINLSIYIVALAVDVTNIIGNGINELLTAPFSAAKGGLDLRLSGGTSTLGLAALLGGTFWAAISAGALFEFVIAFALLPAFFIFLAILGVVLLRRALIILLVIFAPVAFAMYCLPNTEKYFKQWWELLLKTLIIYPLIATIFAVSHILSATINHAGQTSGLTDTVASIMSIIALIVPLALIPFAFKLAGGILGRVHETLGGLGKRAHQGILGNPNDKDSWRNRSKRKLLARNAQNNLSMRGLGATFNPRTLRPGGQARAERRAARASARNMWDSHYGVEGTAMKMYDRYKDDSNVTGDLALHSSGSASRKAIEDDIAAGKFTRGSAEHQQRLFSSAAADQIGRT